MEVRALNLAVPKFYVESYVVANVGYAETSDFRSF